MRVGAQPDGRDGGAEDGGEDVPRGGGRGRRRARCYLQQRRQHRQARAAGMRYHFTYPSIIISCFSSVSSYVDTYIV